MNYLKKFENFLVDEEENLEEIEQEERLEDEEVQDEQEVDDVTPEGDDN